MNIYYEYFGLKENPFSIAPDPHYLYLSEGHREALAHLVYGINSNGGFTLLTGEVGTGKTTVSRCLLEHVPENTEIAFILNPKLTVEELLATICDEFGISYPEGNKSNKVFISAIYEYLLHLPEKGRRAILVVEEAQHLSLEVLEQIRLLTNLETSRQKLLQIILLGQPELREILAQPQLSQLSQRVTARYHLGPLSKEETITYINHRLTVAGLVRGPLFSKRILNLLFRLSRGIPRLINVICDRALLGAYVQSKDQVDRKTLLTAFREVSGNISRPMTMKRVNPALMIFFVLLFLTAVTAGFYFWGTQPFPALKTMTTPLKAIAVKPVQGPILTNLENPVDSTPAGTRDLAFQALFSQWGFPVNSQDKRSPCTQALDKGLFCINEKGGLSDLRRLNKPAVLTLVNGKGDEYFGTLLTLQDQTAIFSIGKETRKVDIREIASWWSGEYTLFWKPPAAYKGKLVQGNRGLFVSWIDQQLSIMQGRTPKPEGQQIYNESMKKEIKSFQMATGLVPDGIVGPKTIICLANINDTGGPTLIKMKKD
jgi:general secretion pathway protein A